MFSFFSFYALTFPAINPVALSLGPLQIHWYGIGYAVGVFLANLYGLKLLQKKHLWANNQPPLTREALSNFIFWALLGIIIGGRLGNVLLWDPSFYFQHPLEIFMIWHGGMAFHGGFLGLTLAIIFYSYKNNIKLWSMFDIIAAGAPIGIGLVRLCNFINSELWGRITTVPWGVYFPNGGPYPRHPSQIYEAFLEGFFIFGILAFLIFLKKALRFPGFIAGCFALLYAIARIIGEFFRDPDPAPLWFEHLFSHSFFTYGMFLSLPLLVIGLYCIGQAYYGRKKSH